jgi:hypothetical protein
MLFYLCNVAYVIVEVLPTLCCQVLFFYVLGIVYYTATQYALVINAMHYSMLGFRGLR